LSVVLSAGSTTYVLNTNILVHYVRRDAVGQRIEATHALLTSPDVLLINIVTEAEPRSLSVQWGSGAARAEQLAFLLSTL